MGSLISRPSSLVVVPSLPELPFDIYLEIFCHLQAFLVEDRKALLSLSLCCKSFRDPIQRILFGNMRCGLLSVKPNQLLRLITMHLKFLRAIVNSPDRLALYVVSYSQQQLAWDPKSRTTVTESSLAHRKQKIQLWTLTETALPLMINLKILIFAPLIYRSSSAILQNCTFQLESLIWEAHNGEKELYDTFLPTQSSLVHLNVNSDRYNYSERPALPDGMCTSLTSVACFLRDLERISAERPIVALQVAISAADIAEPPPTELISATVLEGCVAALRKIHSLRLWTLPHFHRITNSITLHNITELHIRVWNMEDISLLVQFPNLRALKLGNQCAPEIDDSMYGQAAMQVFAAFPGIQSILIFAGVSHPYLVYRFLARSGGVVDKDLLFMDDY